MAAPRVHNLSGKINKRRLRGGSFPTKPSILGGMGKRASGFNAQAFLESAGVSKKIVEYQRGESIFAQGDPGDTVMYIQAGGVKLSVLSKTGKEAVIAMLAPGDFFGEGCLAGQPLRIGSAAATTATRVLE